MLNLLAAFKIIDLCISVLNLAIKALKRLLAEPSSLVTQLLLISPDCRGFFHSSARWVGSSGQCQHFPPGDAPDWGRKTTGPGSCTAQLRVRPPGQGEHPSLCTCRPPRTAGTKPVLQRPECAAPEGPGSSPARQILMSYILLMREASREEGRSDLLPRAHTDP